MTVATTEAGVVRIGDGVTTEFPFSFEASLASGVKAGLIIGQTVVPINTNDYEVTVNESGVGGSVAFDTAPVLDAIVYLYRETELSQLVSVSKQTKYDPSVVERVWDKLTFILQEHAAKLVRAVLTTPDEDPALLLDSIFAYKTDAELAAAAAGVQAMAAAASAAEALAKQNSMLRARGTWVTATAYAPSDIVRSGAAQYICLIAHTSGVFATDLGAARWQVWLQDGATGAGTGDMNNTDNLSGLTNKPLALSTIGGQPADNDLTALAAVTANGLLARTGAGAAAARTLTAGAGISIVNGDGVAGNPTITAANTGLIYLGTKSITSDATGIVTGLGGYRRIRVMGVSLVPSPSAVIRLRVGDAGGLLTTSIYRYTTGITTSFAMSGSTGSACSFVIEIDAFNTTDAIKAVREVGSENTDNRPVCVFSTAVFDRFGVFSSGGANGIASGTLYWWGEV